MRYNFTVSEDWCGTNSNDERQYGKISPKVYILYGSSCGFLAAILYFIFAISWQALRVFTDFWLSDWTNKSSEHSDNQVYIIIVHLKKYMYLDILIVCSAFRLCIILQFTLGFLYYAS